ncbi:MAG: ABC transporter ATP-binding protein [Candidatus Bathyarchaeia archaeon]
MRSILEVRDLNKSFGGILAIKGLDLSVEEGEIVGVIGPNGAGKTTLFNIVTGFIPPSSGTIFFDGHDITGLKPHEVVRLGISRTFQLSILFKELTVLDNVFTGFHLTYRTRVWSRLFRTGTALSEERRLRERAYEIIRFTGLEPFKDELAGNLPHGYQRILGVSIALATSPKLLLLDEPLTGMNALEVERMLELIRRVRERGVTVVLVEHNMKAVMNLCERIVVLNYGVKIAEGPPDEIKDNAQVIEAYLGRDEDGSA